MAKIKIKYLLAAAFAIISFNCHAQTWTEISNILNSKPAPITSYTVAASGTNVVNTLTLTSIGYRAISVHLTGTWVGGVQFQGSNDTAAGWIKMQAATNSDFGATWLDTITANGSYTTLTTGFKYVRLRCITYTSGTIAGVALGYLGNVNLPPPPINVTVDSVSVTVDSIDIRSMPTFTVSASSDSTTGSRKLVVIGDSVNIRNPGGGGLDAVDSTALKNISTYQQDGTQKTQLTDAGGQNITMDALGGGAFAVPVSIYDANTGLPPVTEVQYTEKDNYYESTTLTGNLMLARYGDAQATLHTLKMDTLRNLYVKLSPTDSTNIAGINTKLGGTLTVGSHAVTNTGTFATQVTSLPAIPAGTNNIGDVDVLTLPALPAGNNNIGDVDIASGTVTANQGGTWNINNLSGTVSLPTGASTETTLSTLNGKVPSGLTVNSNRLLVDGSGVTQPVSGTVTATITRLKASTDTTTASLDVTDSTNLAGINTKLGGTLTVGSHAVTQSGTWNITNVSGTVSLPTGASTEATLSTLNGKVPSGLTVNANRLAIYSPDSIRVFGNGLDSAFSRKLVYLGSGANTIGKVGLATQDSSYLANISSSINQWNGAASGRNYMFVAGMAEDHPPFTRTDGAFSPFSMDLKGNLRVAVSGAGEVAVYSPNRSAQIGEYVEASVDTFGRSRVVDTAVYQTLATINSKIRDTLGGIVMTHDSMSYYLMSDINNSAIGVMGNTDFMLSYMLDSMSVHHQQVEDSLHLLRSLIFEELQSIEQQIIVIKNTNHSQIKDSLSAIIQKIPSGLTVNSNRLAIYSPDSLKIHSVGTLPVSLASVPSHAVTNAGTFAVQVDEFTAASLPLPTGASSEATLSSILSRVPSGLTVNSNRLAIYSPDSIKIHSVGTIPVSFGSLPAGTNNIGDVDILSLPSIPAGTNNIGDVDVLSMPTTTVQGTAANDAALSGNPVNIGAKGVNAEPTAVTADRQVQLIADLAGKLINSPYANSENFISGSTSAITDTTSTSVIAAAGSGVRNYITTILITNSHATVSTFVKILDGTTTLWQGYALAAGGGFSVTFPVPLRGTANTAINAKCVTTGANVVVNCAGYKGR